jgi:hypothetical protein
LRTADALAGKSTKPLNIRVQIGSGEFGADLYLASDKNPNIQIIGIPDISNPKLHKRAQDEFDENPQKLSIKGSLGYKEIPSRAAVLRIAYLLAFSYFGYGYILYDNLKQVREQILNPEHETDAIKAMVWINEVPKTNVLAFLKQPQDLQCFFAILELVSEQKHVIGVALPGPDPDSSTIYQRWSAASATLNENTKPMMDIFDFNASYLSDVEFKFLPAKIWHSLAIINEKKP